jgi:hypothetical protein
MNFLKRLNSQRSKIQRLATGFFEDFTTIGLACGFILPCEPWGHGVFSLDLPEFFMDVVWNC